MSFLHRLYKVDFEPTVQESELLYGYTTDHKRLLIQRRARLQLFDIIMTIVLVTLVITFILNPSNLMVNIPQLVGLAAQVGCTWAAIHYWTQYMKSIVLNTVGCIMQLGCYILILYLPVGTEQLLDLTKLTGLIIAQICLLVWSMLQKSHSLRVKYPGSREFAIIHPLILILLIPIGVTILGLVCQLINGILVLLRNEDAINLTWNTYVYVYIAITALVAFIIVMWAIYALFRWLSTLFRTIMIVLLSIILVISFIVAIVNTPAETLLYILMLGLMLVIICAQKWYMDILAMDSLMTLVLVTLSPSSSTNQRQIGSDITQLFYPHSDEEMALL